MAATSLITSLLLAPVPPLMTKLVAPRSLRLPALVMPMTNVLLPEIPPIPPPPCNVTVPLVILTPPEMFMTLVATNGLGLLAKALVSWKVQAAARRRR